MGEIVVRKMKSEDLDSVVRIHLEAFPGFFLSFLGSSFLRELYISIISDPSGLAYVSVDFDNVNGFVAGTDNPVDFYQRLLRKRWWRFAWAASFSALKRPTIILRLIRSFSRGQQPDVRENCATLMSIAISPEAQRNGIGRSLVKVFLQEALNRKLMYVNLTTDKFNNEAVNRFYQNLGFILYQTFITPEGRAINEYQYEL